MIVRIALILLALWLALSLLGRWRRPLAGPRRAARIDEARRCPACGAFVIAADPGPCARPDCPSRTV